LSPQAIEQVATGRTFIGSQALDAGLIDGIAEIDSALEGSDSPLRAEEPTAGITAGNEQPKTTEEAMEMEKLTLDELKTARPDLLSAFGTTEREAGAAEAKAAAETDASTKAAAEKARVSGILTLAQALGGVEASAMKAINDGLAVEAAELAMKTAKLEALGKASPQALGGGNADDAKPAADLSVEEKAEQMWALEATKKEFSSKESLLGYLKALAKGSVKVFQGNKLQK
jgi:hypothetical protein